MLAEPDSVYVVVSHMVASMPAFAVAAPLMVMVIVDTEANKHPVFGLAVNVNVTTPVWPTAGV